jgi:hypothetical protein
MTDTLSPNDVSEKTVKRDSDGELIPETHEIDWGGESKTVKTVPITTGVVNELSHIDDEIAELKPSAVYTAFETIYVEPDPSELSENDIEDLEFQYLEALMSPLDDQMSEDIGGNEGNPTEMTRQERAQELRANGGPN